MSTAGVVREDFDGTDLDASRWTSSYLPAWASREENAARHRVTGDGLVLEVAADQGLWCAATHPTPLRTSTIASGDWSGPLGSHRGPQPFASGLTVRQEQPRFTGWLVSSGYLEIRCRMELTARSMAALWLAGWDERPEDGGELCIVEVFGSSLRQEAGGGWSAEVGVGIKAKQDTRLVEDFAAPRLPLDVRDWHVYRVDWDEVEAVLTVDGAQVRRCPRPPTYPMVLMLGVFDFPDSPDAAGTGDTGATAGTGSAPAPPHVPVLEVSHLEGTSTTLPAG